MQKALYLLIAALFVSFSGHAKNITSHSSKEYVDNQFYMLQSIFSNLKITKTNDSQIKIVIPSDYGFETGKSTLRRPMKDQLSMFSKFLMTYPESTIEVYGHTDNVGKPQSNMKLGLNRARSVENVLLTNNISHYRLKAISEGEELPLCSNKTEAGRECNRRVEMIMTLDKPEFF